MKLNTLVFVGCMAFAVLMLALPEVACTPAQRGDALSAAVRAGPCIEACAPFLLEEVATIEDAGPPSSLAFALEAATPPPRRRVVVHRRCTSWVPVLADAGADADAEAGPR